MTDQPLNGGRRRFLKNTATTAFGTGLVSSAGVGRAQTAPEGDLLGHLTNSVHGPVVKQSVSDEGAIDTDRKMADADGRMLKIGLEGGINGPNCRIGMSAEATTGLTWEAPDNDPRKVTVAFDASGSHETWNYDTDGEGTLTNTYGIVIRNRTLQQEVASDVEVLGSQLQAELAERAIEQAVTTVITWVFLPSLGLIAKFIAGRGIGAVVSRVIEVEPRRASNTNSFGRDTRTRHIPDSGTATATFTPTKGHTYDIAFTVAEGFEGHTPSQRNEYDPRDGFYGEASSWFLLNEFSLEPATTFGLNADDEDEDDIWR
ncbi:hypothetical protein SAMN04488063_1124 [Halopelagius inordinatus]|uniref:Uncharacterized protein n=1 Tax=Halopelagius inordinatus TaxID=553467 RepID=A0A1I2NIA6_9EURY|nr:hypothetical protein [Halopelagius inordinatus]SFG01176.1 hypothetical protein SAMN04488063_1124 [Halopelagius inordinatus]